MVKSNRDEDGRIPRITKTCKVVLDGPDQRLPIREFTLTEKEPGPVLEQFANEGFKYARASLQRLMTPAYKITVIDGEREESWNLTNWIKLVDREKEHENRAMGKGSKQPIRKAG
jgi:hypothetical protein